MNTSQSTGKEQAAELVAQAPEPAPVVREDEQSFLDTL